VKKELSRETKKARRKQQEVLDRFISVYCMKNHGTPKGELCDSCADLAAYSRARLERCPHDPKPACKNCPTHCYKPSYRSKIREVMRFSGMHFVKRGRLDWVLKYFT